MRKCPRPHGFSLVELHVVIGIVVVLIAMLLPTLRGAREDAVRVQCANNLRQIGMGLELYEQAHKRLPGGGNEVAVYFFALDLADGPGGPADGRLTVAPGAPDLREALLGNKSCVADTFVCPRHDLYGQTEGASSYAMNRNYSGSKFSKGRSDIILAYESTGVLSHAPGGDDESPPTDDAAPAPDGGAPLPDAPYAAYRHRLRANWLFFDGHVDVLTGRDAAGPRGEGWGTSAN